MDKLAERLIAFRKSKNLSKVEMAGMLGISSQLYGHYENERNLPKPDFYKKWIEVFGFDISETNVSDMSFMEKRRVLKSSQQPVGMPVFESAPATLGAVSSYRDESTDNPDFWLSIPQYRHCNYACRAKGDSMHPVVRNNALVGGRELLELSVIMFGDIYIIHTKNGIETIKYIHPDPENEEKVLLVPYNGNAKTTPIHKSEILRLYVAEFVINPL